ncbi:MAG: sulfatase [Planctomycetota bacterium]
MKAVVVLLDSLNRAYLPAYGCDWVKTPHIDRLAARSIAFDNHWLGSAPCMPARRDMMTGRYNFLERGWSGLEPFDVTLPQMLSAQGVHSHIETDHAHYVNGGGEFYHTSFKTWQLHRGQETDRLPSTIADPPKPDHDGNWKPQIIKNRRRWQDNEAEMPTPKTFQGAVDWLRMNPSEDDYLLWVEAFDPHEPFEAPARYIELYEAAYEGKFYDSSGYERVAEDSPETRHLRALYAATLTMADHWLGKLLDEIESQGGFDDTLIILTTDHGHLLGEHGCTGKTRWHSWNQLAHLPLLIHLPGDEHAGQRRDALTQNIDLVPTLLEFFGAPPAERPIHGESWWPAIRDGEPTRRRGALYGTFGKTVSVTDGQHTYLRGIGTPDNQPLYEYFLMPTTFHSRFNADRIRSSEFGPFLAWTDCPVLRRPTDARQPGDDPELYTTRLHSLRDDYAQEHNLAGTELEARYVDLLRACMQDADAPAEQFVRLGMSPADA